MASKQAVCDLFALPPDVFIFFCLSTKLNILKLKKNINRKQSLKITSGYYFT
jgi:hypothetical protein